MISRDQKQLEIHNTILAGNVWHYFIGTPGFGKTRVGINLIIECLKRNPNRIIHVVVPSKRIKKQWLDQITKLAIKNTIVYIINSYVNKKSTADLLILDECHRAGSQVFSQVFDLPFRFKYFLGLTGTLTRPDGKHEFIKKTFKCAGVVTYEEAVENGWVKKVSEYNIPVYLNEEATKIYDKITEDYNRYFTLFSKQFDLAKACAKDPQARKELSLMIGVPESMIKTYAFQFNLTMNKRKTFLWTNLFKLEAAEKVINFYKNRKIICFGETQIFADILASKNSRCKVYHSGIRKTLLDSNIEEFEDSENGVLVTVKAVDEGYDLPSIGVGLNIGYNSQYRPYQQRRARVCRIDEQEKIFINFYLKNSKGTNLQDYTWLKAAQKGINGIKSLSSLDELFELEEEKELLKNLEEIENNKYSLEKDYTDL